MGISVDTGNLISLYPFCHRWLIFTLASGMNNGGLVFPRMYLLQLAAYMLAYDNPAQIDECNVCQTPLIQNPDAPWHHSLKNTTNYFDGLKYRKMIRVLPSNSFASGNNIQVCIGEPCCMPWTILFGFALDFFYTYASAKSLINSPSKVLSGSQKVSYLSSPKHFTTKSAGYIIYDVFLVTL